MTAPNATDANPVETVTNLALGYLMSRALHVAAELRLADHLGAGARPVESLVQRTGTDAMSLRRLLRSLAAHGVFAEDPQGRFGNTPASELLRDGAMRDGVLLCGEVAGDGSWWQAVGALRDSVTSGEPAFERQHGAGFFEYIGARPACRAYFDRGMANFAGAEDPAIAAAFDFSRFAHVVDVGGGRGGLLAQLLQRHPRPRATLFDLPQVVRDPAALAAAGLAGRWSALGGDFFESVPPGGDAYLLKRILHDWSDDACLRILHRCREAMSASARLLVVDAVLPAGNAPHPAKVMDVLMMVFGGGRERTEAEFATLFARCGLRLARVTATASTLAILEAEPV